VHRQAQRGRACRAASCKPPVRAFRRGDANDDGKADLSDAVFALSWLFGGGPAPGCQDAADTNDNGGLDISDAIFLLSYLFNAGAPLPTPGTLGCGVDPTEDAVDCGEYGSCS
jgi:hypothetical protein